jgi:citrate synthase
MKGDTRPIVADYEEMEDIPVHKGLVNVHVDESLISFIDGERGKLFYRGYPIESLVEKSSFEEVSYLLIYGELPTKSQLENHKDLLIKERNIPDNVLRILKSFPRNTTRIELLRTAISALSLYDPEDYVYTEDANIRKGLRIMSKMPTIIAFSHRIQQNQPLIEPSEDGSLNHAENYYYMMTGEKPSQEFADAFDKVLMCHADHSINSSTFSCRVTLSTLSDLYSGVTSAVGTLRGPLHGGANEAVIKYMFNEIKKKDNVIPWVNEKFANGEKIMGFGHRVYKTWDPRAKILRGLAQNFFHRYMNGDHIDRVVADADHDHQNVDYIFEMTEILADYMIEQKGIYPNVDLYSASLLHILGIPIEAFTPLFAASRCAGWVAHAIEQLKDNKLIRPRLKYIGELDKEYVDISKR